MSLLGARGEKVCSGHVTLNGQTDHHMVPTEQGPNNRAKVRRWCWVGKSRKMIPFVESVIKVILGEIFRIKMLQLKNLNTNSTSSTCMFLRQTW